MVRTSTKLLTTTDNHTALQIWTRILAFAVCTTVGRIEKRKRQHKFEYNNDVIQNRCTQTLWFNNGRGNWTNQWNHEISMFNEAMESWQNSFYSKRNRRNLNQGWGAGVPGAACFGRNQSWSHFIVSSGTGADPEHFKKLEWSRS